MCLQILLVESLVSLWMCHEFQLETVHHIWKWETLLSHQSYANGYSKWKLRNIVTISPILK